MVQTSKGLKSFWREWKKPDLGTKGELVWGNSQGMTRSQSTRTLSGESSSFSWAPKASLDWRRQRPMPPPCSPQISTSPKPWTAQSRRCCPSAQQWFWSTAQHWCLKLPSGGGEVFSTARTQMHIKFVAWKTVSLRRWQIPMGYG